MRGVSPLFNKEGPHPKHQEPWCTLAEQAGAATPVEGCYKRKLLLYYLLLLLIIIIISTTSGTNNIVHPKKT
jgi:hypothetical protein